MLDMLVGGFLLTGSVCAIDADGNRGCRDVPELLFGNKYACDRKIETIVDAFPFVAPETIGFAEGEKLRVNVRCIRVHGRA